jgi:2-keto-4-pentenoate hydratase/2-oxohepta-3-ene-1,7-dioic acid hydratase in catechol pathway
MNSRQKQSCDGWLLSAIISAMVLLAGFETMHAAEPVRFLRFQKGTTISYGILEGEQVRQLSGDLFGKWSRTETRFALKEVKILTPTTPSQVLAMAGNYRSHLGNEQVPAPFQIPQPFLKSPSCLIPTGEEIVLPRDSEVVHYEAEMVVVIGKTCRKVSKEQALEYVFGVTPGNDVSERIWQNDTNRKDIQWWRAKGTDTFGPVGPYILTGVDYGNLKLTMRVNGKVVQEEKTDHLIHDVPTLVSFISQYVTLHPGDLIYTGTPGKTSTLKPGDITEVELEGAGILRNPVVAGQ